MSETPDNVIPFNPNASGGSSIEPRARPPSQQTQDRNVVLVEAVLSYVKGHPATRDNADTVEVTMTVAEAQILRDLIRSALAVCERGPDEFEAWACKDLLHFEQWLRHYDKQVRAFLDTQDEVPSDWA